MHKNESGIYVLRDPRTKEVRYVGQSTRLRQRKWSYSGAVPEHRNSTLSHWRRSLREKGLTEKFEVVELVGAKRFLAKAERWWIKKYIEMGYDLVNDNLVGYYK